MKVRNSKTKTATTKIPLKRPTSSRSDIVVKKSTSPAQVKKNLSLSKNVPKGKQITSEPLKTSPPKGSNAFKSKKKKKKKK